MGEPTAPIKRNRTPSPPIQPHSRPEAPRIQPPETASAVEQASAPDPRSSDTTGRSLVQKPPYLGVFGEFGPVPSLENSGSVARDHLANERTWLAYVRTSLAVASAGVALVQLFAISINRNTPNPTGNALRKFVRPLGGVAVALGLLLLWTGFMRYFKVQSALIGGKFPPARKTIAYLSAALVVVVAVAFGFLVGVPNT